MRSFHAAVLGCVVGALCAFSSACGTRIAQTTAQPTSKKAAVVTQDAGAGCGALANRVRVATFDARSMVMANDEFHPVVIAPRQAGGSFVAWRAAADNTILLGTLDPGDHLVSSTFASFTGSEVHALLAPDDVGGVMAVVADDPDIYSNRYCISPSTPNNQGNCQKLDLLRFDDTGATTWRTPLTKKTRVDTDSALFIWSLFEHTARVVWNGTWYGVYFRSAASSARANAQGEVDMRPSDTLRFIDQDGSVLAKGGWDLGCTNSWSVRLAFDGHFGAACHGNPTPNAMRLAVLDPVASPTPKTLLLLEGSDPYRRALGGLVASSSGFWLSYIANDNATLKLHLARITDAPGVSQDHVIAAATDLEATYPFRVYMAAYGAGQLLLGWKSNSVLQLAIADAADGAVVEGPVAAGASIDQFQDFVSDPNGDVVWAYSSGSSSRVQVVRVAACR
jgi:hypothetical protein